MIQPVAPAAPAWAGGRDRLHIGLLGGSFDPPHEGHVLISLQALRRLGLDFVWWVPTPANPLKSHPPAEAARRVAACRALLRHPRLRVAEFDLSSGARRTWRTLAYVRRRWPGVRFVWLMGADSFADLHRWARWTQVIESVPLWTAARPQATLAAAAGPAAHRYARTRTPERLLPKRPPPAWTLAPTPLLDISSTALRRALISSESLDTPE